MLTEEQQKQLTEYVMVFLSTIHHFSNCTPEQASMVTQFAVGAVLTVMFHIEPGNSGDFDGTDVFMVSLIEKALKREFGSKIKVVD